MATDSVGSCHGLEKALDTPAHIYFKNESVSPIGSHKLNSALAQAYYCKQRVRLISHRDSAGQWVPLFLTRKSFRLGTCRLYGKG